MSASTPHSSAPGTFAAEEDRPLLETKHRPLLIVAVVAVSLCQFFDATIANVALPYMRSALGASIDSISWVLTSFIIASAIATPSTGWLSDRIGSRNLFLGSTVLFLAASAACGASATLAQMVFFRTIQGVAAAFIMPMTQTIMFDVNPPSKQPMTMAVFSMMVMIAPISGPFLGGFLTEYLNWRWIYYVNLPIGIPALVVLWWLLPTRPLERRKLDIFGFAFIGIALASFQLLLDRGQHKDWFASPEIVIEAIIAASALWIFIVHTLHTRDPLFRSAVFRNTNFLFCLSFMVVLGVSVIGLSAVLPMILQSIYGMPVMNTGLMMAPRGVGVMITSLLGGILIRRMDFRYLVFFGYLIAAAGMWLMTTWAIEMDNTRILLSVFIQGLGLGLVFSPMNLMAFATLDPRLRPDGSSLLGLFRNLGGSVGISVIVTLLARNQQISHADIASHVTANSVPGIDWSGLVDRFPSVGSGVMAMIDGEVNRQAMMISYLDNFYLLAWLMVCFAPLAFLLKNPKTPALGEHHIVMD